MGMSLILEGVSLDQRSKTRWLHMSPRICRVTKSPAGAPKRFFARTWARRSAANSRKGQTSVDTDRTHRTHGAKVLFEVIEGFNVVHLEVHKCFFHGIPWVLHGSFESFDRLAPDFTAPTTVPHRVSSVAQGLDQQVQSDWWTTCIVGLCKCIFSTPGAPRDSVALFLDGTRARQVGGG